jgi:hypothetical protein
VSVDGCGVIRRLASEGVVVGVWLDEDDAGWEAEVSAGVGGHGVAEECEGDGLVFFGVVCGSVGDVGVVDVDGVGGVACGDDPVEDVFTVEGLEVDEDDGWDAVIECVGEGVEEVGVGVDGDVMVVGAAVGCVADEVGEVWCFGVVGGEWCLLVDGGVVVEGGCGGGESGGECSAEEAKREALEPDAVFHLGCSVEGGVIVFDDHHEAGWSAGGVAGLSDVGDVEWWC